jgi:hypothetical protein
MSVPWLFNVDACSTEATLPSFDESVSVCGSNLHVLNAESLTNGCELIIRYAPQLEQITFADVGLNIGVNISFSEIPLKDVELNAHIEKLSLPDVVHCTTVEIGRVRDHSTLPLENNIGALITHNPYSDKLREPKELVVIYAPGGMEHMLIEGDHDHIVIMPSPTLRSLTVSGNGVIREFEVLNCLELEQIDIKQRVMTTKINGCAKLKSLRGFGDRLRILPTRPILEDALVIDGFWHDVPEWYEEKRSMLRLSHFDAGVNYHDLATCNDMSGIAITPTMYDGRGSICHWSEAMSIPVEDLSFGVNIPTLITAIFHGGTNAFAAFEGWVDQCISRFEQYKAMRVLVALAILGVNPKRIVQCRRIIAEINHESPLLSSETVNGHNANFLGGQWRTLRSRTVQPSMFYEWFSPMNSVMPLARLDLEIWLNCIEDISIIGIDEVTGRFRSSIRGPVCKDPRIRDLVMSVIAAIDHQRPPGESHSRLQEIVAGIYTDERLVNEPHCCEFLIHHLDRATFLGKEVIKIFTKNIIASKIPEWCKVCLMWALIDKHDSSLVRLALLRLKSSSKLSMTMAKKTHYVAVAGRKAFETGKATRPEWPYLETWRN